MCCSSFWLVWAGLFPLPLALPSFTGWRLTSTSLKCQRLVLLSKWLMDLYIEQLGLLLLPGLFSLVHVAMEVPTIWTLITSDYGIDWRPRLAGFVNRLLSWKGFLPLGRLTYCVYLIHFDFLIVFYAALRKRFYYTLPDQFTTCFGILLICFGMAFVVSVTLEASFLNLEKFIFSSRPKSDSYKKY